MNGNIFNATIEELRQEAMRTVQMVVSGTKASPGGILSIAEKAFEDGSTCEDDGRITEAYLKYQQGMRFMQHALNLPEIKQTANPKMKDAHRQLFFLQQQVIHKIKPSIGEIESHLRERTLNSLGSPAHLDSTGVDEPADDSITYRVKSLQEARLSVATVAEHSEPPDSSHNEPSPPSPKARVPGDPITIHYPSSLAFKGSIPGGEGLHSPSVEPSIPPRALSVPRIPRQRDDFIESQAPYASRPLPSIDYPTLATHEVLNRPPAVATPVEKQDQRLLMKHSTPILRPIVPTPPTIDSRFSVTTWGDIEIGTSGLKNLGNTCYMNAILQCLSATMPFVHIFKDGRWKSAVNTVNPLGSKGFIAQAFSSLVRDMWRGEYTYLSPTNFRAQICRRATQFSGSNQHDAQEFLSFLLDELHEDLNRILLKPEPRALTAEREAELEHLPPQVASAQEWALYQSRNDSIVVDYFQGQFRNRLQCLTCYKTSTTYNTFMYLSLPIPVTRSDKVSLSECLDTFVGEEIMEQSDAWNCPRCKALRRASKQLSLSRLPPVLLIHLKRFSFNGPFTDKLETQVDFPVKGLDLTKFMPSFASTTMNGIKSLGGKDPRTQDPPFIYDLYGVVNHFGNLSSGHYTAHISSSARWLYFDDSRITEVPTHNVVGRPAYILFYKRRM